MKARHLVSLLLVLLLALPLGASAALDLSHLEIVYRTYTEEGSQEHVLDQGYSVGWAPSVQPQLWITIPEGIPIDEVHITAVYRDSSTGEDVRYVFYDELMQTEWLDLSYSEAPTRAYKFLYNGQLIDNDMLLTMSTQEVPTQMDAGYDGGNDDDPGFEANPIDEDPGYDTYLESTDPIEPDETSSDEDPEDSFIQGGTDDTPFIDAQTYNAESTPDQEIPQIESMFAWVGQNGANFFSQPSTQQLGFFPNSTVVKLNETEYDRMQVVDGKVWCPVMRPGTAEAGYVRLDDLFEQRFMTAQEEQDYRNSINVVFGNHESDYAWVPTSGVTLKNAQQADVGSTIPGGRVVHFENGVGTDRFNDDTGALWLHVTSREGDDGYAPYSALTFMSKADETDYLNSFKEQLGNHESNYARVKDQSASLTNIYGQPINQTLSNGQVVVFQKDTADDRYHDDDDNLWLHITTKEGNDGYIRYNALTFMNKAEEQQYLDGQKEQLPTRESNYAWVSVNNAPLTDANGNSTGKTVPFNRVMKFEEGTGTDRYYDGDKLYIHVTSKDGDDGYIYNLNLHFMSKADEESYLNSQKEQLVSRASSYAWVSINNTPLTDVNGNSTGKTVPFNRVMHFEEGTGTDRYYNGEQLYIRVTSKEGDDGYIYQKNLQFMTKAQETDYLNSIAPKPTEQPMPARDSDYAYVGSGGAILANADLSTQRTLGTNSVVKYASGEHKYNKGDRWIPVTVPGTSYTGYVHVSAINFMTKTQENQYLASQTTTAPTASPTAPLTQTRGYMRVTASQYATLHSWESLGAPIIGILNRGDVVFVDGQVRDESGTVWCSTLPMYQNARWGYTLQRDLTLMTAQEVNNYFATQPPTPTAAPTYSPSNFSGYAILTSGGVNFRQAASTTGGIITRLSQGTIVRVINTVTAEGYTWYQVESGGRTGYLRGDMLSLLTIREYQLLMSSPSYNQNGNIITPTATANVGSGSSTWTPRPNASGTITFVTIPPAGITSPSPSTSPDASASPDPNASPTASDGGLVGSLSPSPSPLATFVTPGADPTFETSDSGSGFSPPSLLLVLVVLLVLVAGGLYGYSVYNKSRRKQSDAQAKRLADQNKNGKPGERPAVRRPVPPTQPGGTPGAPGTQAKPGTPQSGKPANGQQQRPGTPGQPGTGGTNPYARPQGTQPPRTQDVNSTVPRAQVDGKPVTGQANPYARPQNGSTPQQQRPGTPTQAGNGNAPGQMGSTPAQGQNSTSGTTPTPGYQRPHMPVAPPPVKPDDMTTPPTDSEGQAPRRRRRRQAETLDNNDKDE